MQSVARDISAPNFKTRVNHANGRNKDIIKTLHNAQPLSARQSAKIAHHFEASSELETAEKIWNYLRSCIKYKADTGVQRIKLPSRFLHDALGDCKSYSLFTSGVLTSLGIPHSFKYASYEGNRTPSHVYIVTNSGIIIDGVWHQFNAEKPYTHAITKNMRIETLTGHNQPVNGFKDWLKNVGDKLKDVSPKTIINAAPRGAYLILIKANAFGWATRLNAGIKLGKMAEISRKWTSIGGNGQDLIRAIEQGAKRKALLNRNATINGPGLNGGGTLAAFMATASGIIAKMRPIVDAAKGWLNQLNQNNGGGGMEQDSSWGNGNTDNGPTPGAGGIDNKTLMIGGAALLAILLLKK